MDTVTWIDIIIVVIFLISTTIALLRGFVREAVSIATWVAAIWLALTQSEQVSYLLPEAIDSASLSFGEKEYGTNIRVGIAFVLIMVGVLVFGGLVNFVLSQIMKAQILKGVDRMLGMLFGLLRASVITIILIMTATAFTTLPQTSTWEASRLLEPFEVAAAWVVEHLPEQYAQQFRMPAKVPNAEIQL